MAERKISTKFAIEGESEYKAAVKGINQEMKVLNSEMAKTASEFANAQNSMEALSAKSDVLAKQFETQTQRVETMREALENARSAQQEWADKQEEAAARVEELNRQLEELKQSEGDTAEEQARLTEEIQQANEALDYATKGYEAATKGAEDWQVRLNYAEADLNKLDDQIQENNRLMEEAKNSTDGCAQSIDQYGKATKQAGDNSEAMGSQGLAAISKLIGKGGGGITALIGYAVKLVDAAKQIAVEMKNAEVIMVRGTGAQGEALKELNETYKEVMATAKSASETVAGSIANLNTRLGLTGELLQEDAALFEKFGRATGTDAAEGVNMVADLLYTFNRNAEDIPQILDALTVASQKSGASVTTLAQATSESAFYAKEYGLSLEDTVAMMAAFEKAGISSNTVARGMKKAYDDVGTSGKTFKQILKGLEDGTLSSADAVDLFGAKGANLATVLQNGKFDLDEMTDALRTSKGMLEDTADAAETFGDKWKGFWNSVWYGGESGSQYTGFYTVKTEAEEATEVLEERTIPTAEQAMARFMQLAAAGDGTAESIRTLTEYLASDEAQALRNVEGYDDLVDSLQGLDAQLAQLDAETAKASESVMGNLDSMMGRFNKVPPTMEQSTVSVIANLQTQLTYMDQYAANMQKAASRGVDEGLLKSLSDGSAESAAILAGLVDATDGEIQVLNEKWNQTEAGKENFSRVMGEIQTDFEETSAQIQADYDEAVDHFNQSAEASSNAIQTMYGVISGAQSMGGKVDAAYAQLGKNAAIAYTEGFNSVPAPKPKKGYASGTDYATAGLHWVGEAGPELMMFAGGETVIRHAESMRLAQAALEAQLKAERRAGDDLSAPIVVATVQNDVDLKGVEALIAGVISAVNNQQPVEFPALVSGVDRQLAHQRKLIEQAGG